MKIATWNVNSIKMRLVQVLEWLNDFEPDILAIQETKTVDEKFPKAEIEATGYQVIFSGQKSFNGIAILARQNFQDVLTDIPSFSDPQRRILAATVDNVRIINLYVPNGESTFSQKYNYKLDWLTKVKQFLQAELIRYPQIIVLGDFNIAPEERDVHDPKLWQGRVLFSDPEREMFQQWLNLGFKDSFRLFNQETGHYSWWDYRAGAFWRNQGLRIDHILVSEKLAANCLECIIDKNPRKHKQPSDHAPVMLVSSLRA